MASGVQCVFTPGLGPLRFCWRLRTGHDTCRNSRENSHHPHTMLACSSPFPTYWLALHPCFFILFVLRWKCFPLPYKTRLLPFFKQDFFIISPVKSFYFYSFVCGNLYLYTFWAHSSPPQRRAGNYTNMCVYTVLMAVSRILTHTNYLVTQCFVKHITKGDLFPV